MEVSESLVQELAPDQASINAAKKLLKPGKWPALGQAADVNTIWGECQGSGSTPYYTMADVSDHGYKCTCPSRKFPCKHVLALFWQFSDLPDNFTKTTPPEWVNDWLGRRRRSSAKVSESDAAAKGNHSTAATNEKKSTAQVSLNQTVTESPLSEAAQAKREADKVMRAMKNREKTRASVQQGLAELQQWINDQLSNGIIRFLKDSQGKCRQIAARLVDAKAANLAARVDELPARILARPLQQQPNAVLQELAKLALLTEAWLTNPDDIDVHRAVIASESREQLINALSNETSDEPSHEVNSISDAVTGLLPQKVTGTWQVIGEKSEMRRNGLLASLRWIVRLPEEAEGYHVSQPENLTLALLLDYLPVSSGSSQIKTAMGKQIKGDVIFYPSRVPYRAILGEHQYLTICDTPLTTDNGESHQNKPALSWRDHFLSQHQQQPWTHEVPFMAASGRVSQDDAGQYWWHSDVSNESVLLINPDLEPLVLGSQLRSALMLLDGQFAELISVDTEKWGMIACL
ncbi:SWIM zinc finger family protein [Motilimonas sp. E26]|uniref:SWIM zinc finger family protein n=1 Tax=Motilimonas sp. E26 TaxID=2865674 RepID=UPI001E5F38C1|nr:SWIM zinc finger family protein [Motilimonas sp. E26]